MRRTALLAVPLLVACACSAAPHDDLGVARSAVIGGSPSGFDEDAVVALMIYDGDAPFALCTATLVAPNLAITAHHCTSFSSTRSECRADGAAIGGSLLGPDAPPESLLVYRGQTIGDALNDPSAAAAHGIAVVQEQTSNTCNADVVFIVLDHDLPGRFAPLRTKTRATVGEPVTAVGYGVAEDGQLSPDRLHRDHVLVTHVGPVELDSTTQRGLGDSEIAVAESVCAGDSGGPLLSASGAVVGVAGRGGNGLEDPNDDARACTGLGVTNVFTTIAAKPALVAEAFQKAGHAIRTENDRPRVGDGQSCEQSFDCSSDACLENACAVRCETTSCTGGLLCAPFEDKQVCIDPAFAPAAARGSGCSVALPARSQNWPFFAVFFLLAGARRRARARVRTTA